MLDSSYDFKLIRQSIHAFSAYRIAVLMTKIMSDEWPSRQGLEPGSYNILSHALVEPSKILLPPLHIKLGLMKNFVKVLDREGR